MLKSRTNKTKNAGRSKLGVSSAPDARDMDEASNLVRPSKLVTIITMLRLPEGASIVEPSEATGWTPKSIRGVISGAIRKRRLMKVTSVMMDGLRRYRITG
jgi:Protein of unknown function (DUF3489)